MIVSVLEQELQERERMYERHLESITRWIKLVQDGCRAQSEKAKELLKTYGLEAPE